MADGKVQLDAADFSNVSAAMRKSAQVAPALIKIGASGTRTHQLARAWQMDVEARVKSLADVDVSEIGQRYKMQEELGSGAQATVYKGQNKKSGGKVAIKVLEQAELEDDELFDALRMEVGLLKQVAAPGRPP